MTCLALPKELWESVWLTAVNTIAESAKLKVDWLNEQIASRERVSQDAIPRLTQADVKVKAQV